MDYVVGVDIGTQSTKAVLCDATGRIVAQYAKAYQPDTPRPLWAEQWPQVWLDAVEAAVAGCVTAAAAQGEPAGNQVRGLCVSGLYGGSGIPVDADMQPLHPCLIWMDRRAEAECDWVRANINLERLMDVTGNGVDSYYGFTKMLWLKRNAPEVWARTRWFVPPNAFVIQALTGELAVDRSSAGNIGGVYDFAAATWSVEMLGQLGISPTMMPDRLVGSSDVVGRLASSWAARLSLPVGTPVVAGGVDAAVATFAAGATRSGQHVAMIGTSMCWGSITQHVDARHGLISMPHVFGAPNDAYVFGGAITAGACVTWFREQFCAADEALALTRGDDVYSVLDAAAGALSAGAEGLVFLPYLMGERSPIWDGRASGTFTGLGLHHTRSHLYRAVLEGVAFALRHNIEAGLAGTGALDLDLIVVGGAAKSDLWMQIIADVTGRPVLTIAQDVEAALGAAVLAALGAGLITVAEAARGWVTLAPRAQPRAAQQHRYDVLFTIYTALYPALRTQMHRLQDAARC